MAEGEGGAERQNVRNRWIQRVGQNFDRSPDLDGILADYSSTAVMFTPEGPLKGPASNPAALSGHLFGVWKTRYFVLHDAALGRWRLRLHSLEC